MISRNLASSTYFFVASEYLSSRCFEQESKKKCKEGHTWINKLLSTSVP